MKNQMPQKQNPFKQLGNLKTLKTVKPLDTLKFLDPLKASKACKTLLAIISEYWLLCFFVVLIAYLELLYRIWIFKNISADYFFPLLFALSAGIALYLIISLIPVKAAGIAATVMTLLVSICYGVQLIYYCIFRTPFSLVSIGAAGDVLQFQDIIIEAILKNAVAVVLLFLPLFILVMQNKKLLFSVKKPLTLGFILLFCISSYSAAIICVNLTGDSPASQNTLYYKASSPDLSVNKLGVLTTMRLDFQRLVAGALQNNHAGEASAEGIENGDAGMEDPAAAYSNIEEAVSGDSGTMDTITPSAEGQGDGNEMTDNGESDEQTVNAIPMKPFNTMEIDFDTLLASGQDENLNAMNKYFSTVDPTATNQYTGMFKGYNLIFLTAEAFSPYAVSPELTPTLYKMINEGFVFKNFYNPVWWVSTSDGEYVACTGLIPKGGVWSLAASGKNYMPFAMGNQFKKLGYVTKAYHDHTYTYYKRDISHPNLGYDYKGVGNGLIVKKSWPESDLEMINVTADEYMGQQPFHTYYMTVSGHMNYSFNGNYMASKNREFVTDLPYSDASKAYIACNLELEFAMKALIEKLEAAGIADKTVIALSPDHYPYGLPRENIDELAGHKVEENFELYKSTLILWKKGMEPVIVEKPCASLDIIPTLSNLFGLEYDSRLLMGSDILSDTPALVIFSNRSWITDRAIYNSVTNEVIFKDGATEDKAYIKNVNRVVADKFKYSTKILETDYYKKILP